MIYRRILLALALMLAVAPTLSAQSTYDGSRNLNVNCQAGCPGSAASPATVIGAGGEQVANPTVTTGSAYAAGNCVGGASAGGNAIQTIALSPVAQGQAIPAGGNFWMDGATLTDAAKQNAQVFAYVFDAAPSGTYTDKAACTLAAADQSKVVAVLSWGSYQNDGAATAGTAEAARLNGLMPVHISVGNAVTTFWTVWWTTGTPTYTAKALTAKFTVSY